MFETWVKRDEPTVEVEAVRLNEGNVWDVATAIGAQVVEERDPEHPEEFQEALNVQTPTGTARASLGMYVARFAGRVVAVHNRAFEEKYTPKTGEHPPPTSLGESRRERGLADPWGRW